MPKTSDVKSKPHHPLIVAMRSKDWEVRMEAAERAREFPPSIQRRVLTMGCGDTSELVRITAIEAIERLADRKFRPALLAALSDRNVLVRTYAASGLVPICTRDDIAVLERHLPGSRSTFRVALLWALCALGQSSRIEPLLKVIAETSDYHDVCIGARLIVELKLTDETKALVIETLRKVRARFDAVAVDEAVADALSRIRKSSRSEKRRLAKSKRRK
jgi:HEAT repeat protein